MFDLDIKYESLSGKNPDTKRLLSHVLRTVKLDKSAGVDFSGERLFVEAFPRPDGGCMLYISCLAEENKGKSYTHNSAVAGSNFERRTVRMTAKSVPEFGKSGNVTRIPSCDCGDKSHPALHPMDSLLCRFGTVKELGGVCKSLSWQQTHGKLHLESALYNDNTSGEYRLLLQSDDNKRISAIVSEYGEVLPAKNENHELSYTYEHYNLLVPANAVEKMNEVL
jgi:hypothetical protein